VPPTGGRYDVADRRVAKAARLDVAATPASGSNGNSNSSRSSSSSSSSSSGGLIAARGRGGDDGGESPIDPVRDDGRLTLRPVSRRAHLMRLHGASRSLDSLRSLL